MKRNPVTENPLNQFNIRQKSIIDKMLLTRIANVSSPLNQKTTSPTTKMPRPIQSTLNQNFIQKRNEEMMNRIYKIFIVSLNIAPTNMLIETPSLGKKL